MKRAPKKIGIMINDYYLYDAPSQCFGKIKVTALGQCLNGQQFQQLHPLNEIKLQLSPWFARGTIDQWLERSLERSRVQFSSPWV